MNNFLLDQLNELKKKKIKFPELELRILLNKTSIKKKEIIFSNFHINDINLSAFNNALKRRINSEPLSKIFNEKNFWKDNFYVTKDVLDPRPETELILEKVLEFFPKKTKKFKILDMCTGSGCLAISLSKEYKNSKIIATDISSKAIAIAKQNSEKILSKQNNVKFIKCDLIEKEQIYDIIVSNPPYLSEIEYENISQEIKLFEPKIALNGGKDGLDFYRKIAKFLNILLGPKSLAFIEIGSNQANEVINIFKKEKIENFKIIKDIQLFNRLIIIKKNID